MISLPAIPVTTLSQFCIVRGDLIQGGAKMPALLRYLPRLNHNHIAYVGSVFGSGAWAVAEACAALDLKCSIFLSKSKYVPPWCDRLTDLRANIYWTAPQPVADIHREVTLIHPDLHNLPLGFDTPDFIADMSAVMHETVPTPPPEIWVPALSGVLARAACLAFPTAPIHAVSAVHGNGDLGRAIRHKAPEKFHKSAAWTLPPYPACPFSDAKVWQFAEKMAVSGAVIWNVSS